MSFRALAVTLAAGLAVVVTAAASLFVIDQRHEALVLRAGEPVRLINAYGLNYYLVESDADAPRISVAFEEAAKTKRPVVVLVGDEYHGFNR